jgi:hypothetical protein
MNELTSQMQAAERWREPSLTSPARFVYSGILFEWMPSESGSEVDLKDPRGRWHPSVAVGPAYSPFLYPPERSRPMARVSCVVSRVHGPRSSWARGTLADPPAAGTPVVGSDVTGRTELVADEQGDSVTVWCGDAECVVRRIAQGEYVALARMGPSSRDHGAALAGVTSAVVQGEGGLFLHASVVQKSGRAIAFVGPSGEGKSTAARAMRGATLLSVDRAILMPSASGWVVWSQPGGTMAQEDQVSRERNGAALHAVIRVRKAERVAVRSYPMAEAMFALRESVLAWRPRQASGAHERELLSRVAQLAHDVPVGELCFPKGVSVDEPVDAWLSETAMREPWT